MECPCKINDATFHGWKPFPGTEAEWEAMRACWKPIDGHIGTGAYTVRCHSLL